MTVKLSRKERHFLSLLNEPGATVGVGLSVGKALLARRLVSIAKFGRYGITPEGVAALQPMPRARRVEEPRFL